MPYLNLEDIKIYYDYKEPESQTASEQSPIVFLHGFTLDRRMWHPQIEFFGKSYRVFAPDARGHGLSAVPKTNYSRDHRVEDLKLMLDRLGVDKIHLVGLSMGGSTAIGFALKYARYLKSLTLVDTGAAGFYVGPKIRKIDNIAVEQGIEAARLKWMKTALMWYKKDHKDIRDLIEQMMLEHSGAIWVDPMRGKYPSQKDIELVHEIRVPTRIFVGELDKIFIPLSEELNKRIIGSKLSVYEGVGHMLNLEAPDKFNKELLSFVDSNS